MIRQATEKTEIAVENITGTTLRMSLKMLNGNNLPHQLLQNKKRK